jgi:hypothetical protein
MAFQRQPDLTGLTDLTGLYNNYRPFYDFAAMTYKKNSFAVEQIRIDIGDMRVFNYTITSYSNFGVLLLL